MRFFLSTTSEKYPLEKAYLLSTSLIIYYFCEKFTLYQRKNYLGFGEYHILPCPTWGLATWNQPIISGTMSKTRRWDSTVFPTCRHDSNNYMKVTEET